MPSVTMVQHLHVQITNRRQRHLGNAAMHCTEPDNPMLPAHAHCAWKWTSGMSGGGIRGHRFPGGRRAGQGGWENQ